MAEPNRFGIAAMFSANADLKVIFNLAPPLDTDLDQFSNAFKVDGYERVRGKDAMG